MMEPLGKIKYVLIADDDPAILDAMKMLLEFDGYTVETTQDGSEVAALVKLYLPRLLILDTLMSGVDGRDICRKLRADPATASLAIIMISATSDVKNSARDAGADDFITKPFELSELLSKVKKYIER